MTKFWNLSSGSNKIDPEALFLFLKEKGFYTLQYYEENKILVRIEDKKVKSVNKDDVHQFCYDYINSGFKFGSADERTQVIKSFFDSGKYFSQDNLLLLESIEINEVADTQDTSYLFFNNCYVQINADKIEKLSYENMDGLVWEEDLINHDFEPDDMSSYEPKGEFYEFFQDLTKNPNKRIELQNRDSLTTIIGYLIHRYKDPAIPKAIILMDTYKDGNPQGGTGKGLFSNSISRVRKIAFQDGKAFYKKDQFALSHVTFGTRLITFDDVPKDFNFERIFPLITENAVIERKYKNKFVIPYERSPKVLLSTNYTVEGKGSSHARRKVEFILSDTYGLEFTPEDRFGHLLFEHWKQQDWNEFFSFMAYCLQMFLLEGLVEPAFNVGERTLKMNATKQFIDFVNGEIEKGIKNNKKIVFEKFLSIYPDHKSIEQNTFTSWLKLYAAAYKLEVSETHSNQVNYFELLTKQKKEYEFA
jgi:hypothetical protein